MIPPCRLTAFALIHIISALPALAQAPQLDWAARFSSPPPDSRILKIIHGWPDQPDDQDKLLHTLHNQGFGGVVCNVSFHQYLQNNDKWLAFTRAVTKAHNLGFAMWLYDERGYPSANAGGLTLQHHPQWEARGLLASDAASQGGPVSLQLPPGKTLLLAAFPTQNGIIHLNKIQDLSPHLRDRTLHWQAPQGDWRILAITEDRLYQGTHAEANLHAKMPYPNLLLPEPTARFVQLTYGAYAQHLGNNLGKYFMASFTDEPSLMSLFLTPMPYRPLPWASNLPDQFHKQHGYNLNPAILPALFLDAGNPGKKIRHDFWLTVGQLVSDNYFGQIQNACRRLQLPSGGHLLLEESIVGHVPLYGDFFRCIRKLDAPAIDCLTSLPPDVPWFIARLLSSAAELERRPLVMSETSDHAQQYRPPGDLRPKRHVSEDEIRGTCNRLIVSGVNCITSYYTFSQLSDEQLRRLNHYVGRCCAALRGGHQVADIALLYPVESLWTNFVPSRHWTRQAADASRIENVFLAAADALFQSQRDFTFVDSQALAHATPSGDSLLHGHLRWRVVLLPHADTLPLPAWENLARFVRSGGAVIALGSIPANSESDFPSPRALALANEIFAFPVQNAPPANQPHAHTNLAGGTGIFLPRGLEALLPIILDSLLQQDVIVSPPKSPLRATHRRIDGREVYLLINDSPTPWQGHVAFAASGQPERWDPASGQLADPPTSDSTPLRLQPYHTAIYRFASPIPPRRLPITPAQLPNLSLRQLPPVQPTSPHGEFVLAQLAPDPLHSQPASPAWEAFATLTKSNVDTHLFIQFRYPTPLNLDPADCLVIDTYVPDAQATPNQILVILREEGGGDFIADTARSLASPGHERSFIPISRFRLAGWSNDPDGQLDLKRVNDIRIGWGGYLGSQGETIRFSASLPQTANLTPKTR